MRKQTGTAFKFRPFSVKQRKMLNWWIPGSPVKDREGIIADGSIRSGKTICMSLSFAEWAMNSFDRMNFAMCGKSVGSFRRNVLFWLKMMLYGRGFTCEEHRADNLFIVRRGVRENYFYIFGGIDERSQDLIQGITLAGVFLDEVALMPESFVNQATGRCSVDGSKMWFNCNPSYPSHWFKEKWIDRRKEKHLLYLHFTMDDNLSLSERIKERYRTMYSGVFYKRYILGLWALAEGLVYPMYAEALGKPPDGDSPSEYCLSVDYGTMNAFAALLWEKHGDVWYATGGYYYSGRDHGLTKTDEEYADDLDIKFGGVSTDRPLPVIIDPSAASFITLMRKRSLNGHRRYKVLAADNDVMDGIRETATAMQLGLIKIDGAITDWVKEAEGYVWDEKTEDKPVKERDHYMDSTRYFVRTKRITARKQKYTPVFMGGRYPDNIK